MYCAKCGAFLADDARVCSSCGKPVRIRSAAGIPAGEKKDRTDRHSRGAEGRQDDFSRQIQDDEKIMDPVYFEDAAGNPDVESIIRMARGETGPELEDQLRRGAVSAPMTGEDTGSIYSDKDAALSREKSAAGKQTSRVRQKTRSSLTDEEDRKEEQAARKRQEAAMKRRKASTARRRKAAASKRKKAVTGRPERPVYTGRDTRTSVRRNPKKPAMFDGIRRSMTAYSHAREEAAEDRQMQKHLARAARYYAAQEMEEEWAERVPGHTAYTPVERDDQDMNRGEFFAEPVQLSANTEYVREPRAHEEAAVSEAQGGARPGEETVSVMYTSKTPAAEGRLKAEKSRAMTGTEDSEQAHVLNGEEIPAVITKSASPVHEAETGTVRNSTHVEAGSSSASYEETETAEYQRRADTAVRPVADTRGMVPAAERGMVPAAERGMVPAAERGMVPAAEMEEIRTRLTEEIRPRLEEEMRPRLTEEIRPRLEKEIRTDLEKEIRAGLEEEIRSRLEEEIRAVLEKEYAEKAEYWNEAEGYSLRGDIDQYRSLFSEEELSIEAARRLRKYSDAEQEAADAAFGLFGLNRAMTVRLATFFLIVVLSVIYVIGRGNEPADSYSAPSGNGSEDVDAASPDKENSTGEEDKREGSVPTGGGEFGGGENSEEK